MKKIVMISPKFFNIEDSIKDEFIEAGYKVQFFDERINNSKVNKILIRRHSKIIRKKINKYFKEIYNYIEINNRSIHMLFVVKAETMPIWFIKEVKVNFPHIVSVHYMYDPISNYNGMLEKLDYFDYCYTFDKKDSVDQNWIFRPLFFPNEFKLSENVDRDIDITFIGTLHSDRAEVVEAIQSGISRVTEFDQLSIFLYYYIPLYVMFLYAKLVQGRHSKLTLRDIKTEPLNKNLTAQKLMRTKHVVDVHHVSQTGLTARTFEALGSKSKIITTNPQIVHYDFFNENNILVVDRYDPIITKEWLEKEYIEIDDEIYDYYSSSCFVKTFTALLEFK